MWQYQGAPLNHQYITSLCGTAQGWLFVTNQMPRVGVQNTDLDVNYNGSALKNSGQP